MPIRYKSANAKTSDEGRTSSIVVQPRSTWWFLLPISISVPLLRLRRNGEGEREEERRRERKHFPLIFDTTPPPSLHLPVAPRLFRNNVLFLHSPYITSVLRSLPSVIIDRPISLSSHAQIVSCVSTTICVTAYIYIHGCIGATGVTTIDLSSLYARRIRYFFPFFFYPSWVAWERWCTTLDTRVHAFLPRLQPRVSTSVLARNTDRELQLSVAIVVEGSSNWWKVERIARQMVEVLLISFHDGSWISFEQYHLRRIKL